MTLTADIAALCAAIDQGDDEALPALADAMEDAGDPRAAAIRRMTAHGPRWERDYRPAKCEADRTHARRNGRDGWGWLSDEYMTPGGVMSARVDVAVYRRLAGRGCTPFARHGGPDNVAFLHSVRAKVYPTRSAAYLALAEALAKEGAS